MIITLPVYRRLCERVFSGFAIACMLVTILVIVAILWMLVSKGLTAIINMPIFTATTPAPGVVGGLLNAIWGSVIMTLMAMVIATPIGVLVAVYFIDSGAGGRLANIVRFLNDVLLSMPSIIVGLFIYIVIVRTMGHFSAWAGALALAIIALPMIIRTSEDVLTLASDPLREAAFALGAQHWRVAWLLVAHAARSGIITAILLAGARIFGETAPLLFTALSNQFFTTNMNQPMANLPVVIFQYAMSPYADWQSLAWGGALLLTTMVLLTNIVARYISQFRSKF